MPQSSETLSPVRKQVTVPLARAEAFSLFTSGFASWWPLATHSVAEERAVSCRFEGAVGGRIYEIDDDGTEHEWGRVQRWEPPGLVVFSWYPGREPSTAHRVEVRFTDAERGCSVELVHSGWETLGAAASDHRAGYETGWDVVLGRFVEEAGGA